ncbi:MAG TPA: 16S rRNA (uracil(1498)-N(3))-methyltransferase [Mycobacteriales bacterium]|nr:16S rRNA (uracil(1498)-N(3))-methyltransferase [Mycobacteriales bacterium]
MTAPVFLCTRDQLDGDVVVLAGAEGHHGADARRMRPGERLRLTDGNGRVADGVVTTATRGQLGVAVQSRSDVPAPTPRITVVQALAKGDRAERAIEAMTEIGVDEFVPWAPQRAIVAWRGERVDRGLARWRSAAAAAARQSRRVWFPVVGELADRAEVERRIAAATFAVVCHEAADAPLSGRAVPTTGEIVIVIGPEGGLDETELAGLAAAGGQPVRLGPTVLRTGTAGAAAAALLLAASGRWAAVGDA